MTKKFFESYVKNMESFPIEAVKAAMSNKEEAIPELLEILDHTIKNADSVADDEGYLIHIIALYLLAFFKEPEAGKRIAAIATLPEEDVLALLGDVVGQGFDCIIASVYGGDAGYIKQIIEDSKADALVRGDAIRALVILLRYDKINRGELVDYFKELFEVRLERVESSVWDILLSCCHDIHPEGLIEQIRKAYEDNLVDSFFSDPAKIEMQMNKSVDAAMNELRNNECYGFISEEDVFSLPEWITFNPDAEDEFVKSEMDFFDEGYESEDWIDDAQPYRREEFIGRNDPCPCGSGKKYKKCCGK